MPQPIAGSLRHRVKRRLTALAGLSTPPEAGYGFTQGAQLVAQRFAEWFMRTSSTIDAAILSK